MNYLSKHILLLGKPLVVFFSVNFCCSALVVNKDEIVSFLVYLVNLKSNNINKVTLQSFLIQTSIFF